MNFFVDNKINLLYYIRNLIGEKKMKKIKCPNCKHKVILTGAKKIVCTKCEGTLVIGFKKAETKTKVLTKTAIFGLFVVPLSLGLLTNLDNIVPKVDKKAIAKEVCEKNRWHEGPKMVRACRLHVEDTLSLEEAILDGRVKRQARKTMTSGELRKEIEALSYVAVKPRL